MYKLLHQGWEEVLKESAENYWQTRTEQFMKRKKRK